MGHPAGQPADRLHLLGLTKLVFHLLPVLFRLAETQDSCC